MRLWHVGGLIIGVALLAGSAVVIRESCSANYEGHPLLGSWDAAPYAPTVKIPQTMTLDADGTGMDASGVGNFPFRWVPIEATATHASIRTTPSDAGSWSGKSSSLEIELIDADTIRMGHRIYTRRKP